MRKIKGLRWYMLALMALGTLVNYVDRNTLSVLAPILQKDLHFSPKEYSYVVAAFQFCYSFVQPVAGFVTDLIGLRFGYFLFAMVWGTAAALHAMAGNWSVMAAFRGLLGMSEAAAIPAGVKTATVWFPAKERSIAASLFNMGGMIGATITPPLVIWLSLVWGWRFAFLATGCLGWAVALLWLLVYRNPERHTRLSDEEKAYINNGREPAPALGEAQPKPSVTAIISKPRFWGIAAARFLTEPAWQTFSFWIPLYMVSSRHMDIKQFALFAWLPFLAADLGALAGGFLSPFFMRHIRLSLINSRIATVGVGAVCMIGPGLIGMANSPIIAILLFSVGGFAHQTLSGGLFALTSDTFEKKEVGTATGFCGMAGALGGMGFSLIIGQLATAIGYEPLFVCLSVFDITAFLLVCLVLGERKGAALKLGAAGD
jgi:ACS family hexuronate transporter-like MFS transporter